jgi:hypothetical protein
VFGSHSQDASASRCQKIGSGGRGEKTKHREDVLSNQTAADEHQLRDEEGGRSRMIELEEDTYTQATLPSLMLGRV